MLKARFRPAVFTATPKGIDTSRHGPFTVCDMFELYKRFSVENMPGGRQHLHFPGSSQAAFLEEWLDTHHPLFCVFNSDKKLLAEKWEAKEAKNFRAGDTGVGSRISELCVWNFRIGRSQISEQNGAVVGSRFSELGKWRLMDG